MKTADVMSTDLITVKPEASIQAAARLMVDHGVSGLPVVSERSELVGIITERDLIVREKARAPRPWWKLFFQDAEQLAREYQKARGLTVAEVMTHPVVQVSPDTPIASAAAILDQLRIGRLPVVADGALVGIVSRADLVKALAAAPGARAVARSDAELVAEMRRQLGREPWISTHIAVRADNRVLSLYGLVASETERAAIETMARALEGCAGVDNQLIVRTQLPRYATI